LTSETKVLPSLESQKKEKLKNVVEPDVPNPTDKKSRKPLPLAPLVQSIIQDRE
jgi:hypothetical protein